MCYNDNIRGAKCNGSITIIKCWNKWNTEVIFFWCWLHITFFFESEYKKETKRFILWYSGIVWSTGWISMGGAMCQTTLSYVNLQTFSHIDYGIDYGSQDKPYGRGEGGTDIF